MDDSLRDSLPGHLPLIRGIVRRMAPGAGLADDLTQECCVRLIEKEALWRERASPRPWIRAVTRNLALRRLGQFRNRRRLETPLPAEPEAKAGSDPVEEQIAWLLSQFALLPPKQQEVLKMRYFEGLETLEIAEKMGVSESTVTTHHARALETMRRKARHAGWLPGLLAWCVLNKGKAALAAGVAAATVGGAYFFTTDPSTHLAVNSTQLKETVVVAHPDAPIPPGKNVLYCAAFQLAWDELKKLHGGSLQFVDDAPVAKALNKGWLSKENLSPGSVVAMSGPWGNDFKKRLNEALDETFEQGADPFLDGVSASPGDLVAYAFLAKTLSFGTPFERLEKPLSFQGTPVRGFGARQLTRDQARQLKVYRQPDAEGGRVLAIQPRETGEEILLAEVVPGDTLTDTIRKAMAIRTRQPARDVDAYEALGVPMLDLDIQHDYQELVGRKVGDIGPIARAFQSIRFKLDEKGALVRSRAYIEVEGLKEEERSLVFDRPFLLMLRQKDCERPYLALWVENAELLIGQAPTPEGGSHAVP